MLEDSATLDKEPFTIAPRAIFDRMNKWRIPLRIFQ
jgi:hypothetical protein